MTSVSSGYADVNGIKPYHEIYGQGKPFVLILSGLTYDQRDAWMGAATGRDRPRSR